MFDVYLKNAFCEPGCPICRIRRQAVDRYIFRTLWENVNDITFRRRFLAAEGLCPDHAWQLQNTEFRHWQDGFKTGILYESLLVAVRRQLAHESDTDRRQSLPWWHLSRWWPSPASHKSLAAALLGTDACPVCQIGAFNESFYARELVGKLVEPAWQTAYAHSDGLCLPHLRLTLNKCDPESRRRLLAETDARLQTLQDDLSEYKRKHAWKYRHESVSEAERQSWIRAVAWLRGEKPGEA